MTMFVNLFAGPGVGKSTTAADLFAAMKRRGDSVELVTEYVKSWAWEERKPVTYDQFYFFGKQSRREHVLTDRVEVVVTDAPSIITCYYTQVYGEASTATIFRMMALEYRRMLSDAGHTFFDVFLKRVKPYDPRGRFQSAEQAAAVDVDLRAYLDSLKIPLFTIAGDEHASAKLLQQVDDLRSGKR